MAKSAESSPQVPEWELQNKRGEILRAAAKLFFDKGYEATTTREIATLAKTSKRTLYEEFPSKQDMLRALITSSTAEITEGFDLEVPCTRTELFDALRRFGDRFLELVMQPRRISMVRLAIAESHRSPEIAREIQSSGRQKLSEAVERMLRQAVGAGLIAGQDIELVMNAYFYVLQGNLQFGLLLGTDPQPTKETLAKRVDVAMRVVERVVDAGPRN